MKTRPAVKDMTLHVRLTKEQVTRLEALAQEAGVSASEVVRNLIASAEFVSPLIFRVGDE